MAGMYVSGDSPLGRLGLPTELPVSCRQNCFGGRFWVCLRGLTLVLTAVRALFTGAGWRVAALWRVWGVAAWPGEHDLWWVLGLGAC
jgi:hypothetical protein